MFLQESYLKNLAKANKSEITNYQFLTFTNEGPLIALVSGVGVKTFRYDSYLRVLVQEPHNVYFARIKPTTDSTETSLYVPFSQPGIGYFIPETCVIDINKVDDSFEVWVDGTRQFEWRPNKDTSVKPDEFEEVIKQNKNVVAFKRKD